MTEEEIAELIEAWDGSAASERIFVAQSGRDLPFLYLIRSRSGQAKVGASSDPIGRASELNGDLVRQWFLGHAAYLAEQITHASLAPWLNPRLSEHYLLLPEEVSPFIDRLLGFEAPEAAPPGYAEMKWRDQVALSAPAFERLLEWPVPTWVLRRSHAIRYLSKFA